MKASSPVDKSMHALEMCRDILKAKQSPLLKSLPQDVFNILWLLFPTFQLKILSLKLKKRGKLVMLPLIQMCGRGAALVLLMKHRGIQVGFTELALLLYQFICVSPDLAVQLWCGGPRLLSCWTPTQPF